MQADRSRKFGIGLQWSKRASEQAVGQEHGIKGKVAGEELMELMDFEGNRYQGEWEGGGRGGYQIQQSWTQWR